MGMLKMLALVMTLFMLGSSTAWAGQEITVASMVELLNSIGSDRTIYLTPGIYKLDAATGFTSRNAKNTYARSMHITGVNNLKIIAAEQARTQLLSPYSDSDVLFIKDCKNIELRNFSIGHVQRPKGCEGDSLHIERSENIKMDNMDIYGCGQNGLTLENVGLLEVKDSYIHHCTYAVLDMTDVWSSKFINTKFVHDGSLSVMETRGSIQGLAFHDCQFAVDPTRKVFLPKGDVLEYAAKHSLMGERYDNKWWDKQVILFQDCTFTNINSLEIDQLRTKGIMFKNYQIKSKGY